MPNVSPHELFDQLTAEVWLVTVQLGDERAGLICTTVMSASIVPTMPRVIVTLAKQHHTAEVVRRGGSFALSVLSKEQVDLALVFGINSGHEVDKWDGLNAVETPDGHPVFPGTHGWVDCHVEAFFDSGDRWIVLAECRSSARLEGGQTMSVSDLISAADDGQKIALKRLRQRDAECDADAIRAWRAARGDASQAMRSASQQCDQAD